MRTTSFVFTLAVAALFLSGRIATNARAQDAAAPVVINPAGDPNDPVMLTFSEAPLDTVISQLEVLTGRVVIRPPALPNTPITFNNNQIVSARKTLTRAEAVLAIESLLSINGIGVAPLGDKFIKVVPIASIRQEAPELVVTSLRDEPPSGKVISKIFRLQYLDSTGFQGQIAPFLSSFATVVAFQNSNTVIVTDTISNLKRLEDIIPEIDRRQNIETKFYQIKYASATDLAQSIKAMIDSARAGAGGPNAGGRVVIQQPGVVPAPNSPAVPGAPASAGFTQISINANTQVTADERTNQLIVITDPATLPFFDNLIEKLDINEAPATTIEVMPMKYAEANDLASLLSSVVSGRSGGTASPSRSSRKSNSSSRNSTFGTPSSQMGDQNRLQPQRQEAVQNTVQAVTGEHGSQFSQLLTIVADERSNSLIVSGTNSDLALIREVVDKLDVLLAQVRIEVVIADVTLGNGITRGIDAFRAIYSQTPVAAAGGTNGSGGAPAIPANGIYTTGNIFGMTGTISGVLGGGNLSNISIDALLGSARTNSNVNILSVPSVTTMHNKEATFLVGESRPIITGTSTSQTTAFTNQSVQYQDIGIELKVTPRVGPNDVMELEIDQKVDDVGASVTVNNSQQPIINRRQATSTVTVKNGQLVVLGGLQKNSTTKNVDRMFLLGEIPLLGELFSRHVTEHSKSELLVFIKPTVLRTTDDADLNARQSIHELHSSVDDRRDLEKITGEKLDPETRKKNDKEAPPPPTRPADRP